jgi:hypothetical protein
MYRRPKGSLKFWLPKLTLLVILNSVATAAPEAGLSVETLVSDDVVLADYLAYLTLSKGKSDTVLSYKHADYWIDFRPAESLLIGEKSGIYASKDALHLASQGEIGKDLLWLVEGGGYLGFSNYQALWVDEYYRQLFENSPGYQEADPMGVDGALSLRWDYLQTSGFAKFSTFGSHDRISPQWIPVIGKSLSHTRTAIDSMGGRIEFENVLTRRLRTHNSVTVSDATARKPRWSLETMENLALSDSCVVRSTSGYAFEAPDFDAFWTTAAVEWDFQRQWFVGLNTRFYQDSGEVNNLASYGVAAPPATTFGMAVSVRWVEGPNQASLGIGPYWTRFHDKNETSPVAPLHSDRSWLWFQAAWSHQF